jgi:hypothetical protein
LVLPVQAKYSGGSGTAQDPYQIATAADLIAFGATSADYSKHFILTADIDLSGRTYKISPTGSFAGTFDGNHLTIRNLTSNSSGLIGELAEDGRLENLRLENVKVTSYSGSALVQDNRGTIVDCYCAGIVSGSNWVGGLVGRNSGLITNCHTTVEVTGEYASATGGLVGMNESGTVMNCRSGGSVSGLRNVGGLVGWNSHGSVSNSCSTGAVRGRNYSVGGLVGRNYGGGIVNCWSTSAVGDNPDDAGGLVGECDEDGTITNCFSTGAVKGYNLVGGLVGSSSGALAHCYSTGMVSGNNWVGGLVGYLGLSASVTECFWDIDTSTRKESAAGTGLHTDQMVSAHVYLSAGWDFLGEPNNGLAEVWRLPERGGVSGAEHLQWLQSTCTPGARRCRCPLRDL